MTSRGLRHSPPIVLALATLTLAACAQGHSAEWYMSHGDAMRAKVQECKADAQKARDDKDCDRAIEAFVTWARATGNANDPAKPASGSADQPAKP